jgi:hypothetical protein
MQGKLKPDRSKAGACERGRQSGAAAVQTDALIFDVQGALMRVGVQRKEKNRQEEEEAD